MALRFLSPGRRMALVRGRTLSQLSAGLRALSSKDDIEMDEPAIITVRQQLEASHHPAGELLGDTDTRLPLPGRVGLAEHLRPAPPTPPPVHQPARHAAAADLYHDRHMAALFSLMNQSVAEPSDTVTAGGSAEGSTVALEIQVHQCPQLLKQEFRSLFRERDITQGPLTVMVISQRTETDMATWSPSVEEERSQLAEHFMTVASDVVLRLRRLGFWADLVDPRTGRPHLGGAPSAADGRPSDLADADDADVLIETDDRLGTLGFTIEDLGCCKVVQHAVWGSHVFIGCMFTSAPVDHPMLDGVLSRYQDMVVPPSPSS